MHVNNHPYILTYEFISTCHKCMGSLFFINWQIASYLYLVVAMLKMLHVTSRLFCQISSIINAAQLLTCLQLFHSNWSKEKPSRRFLNCAFSPFAQKKSVRVWRLLPRQDGLYTQSVWVVSSRTNIMIQPLFIDVSAIGVL